MDQELRDWLKSLAEPHSATSTVVAPRSTLSEEAADYLARIVTDGTLKAALTELGETDPDLAG